MTFAGGDLRQVPAAWTASRHKDAKALVNIESSFYKLVGGRKLGFLDPAFLRLVVHIAFGQSSLLPAQSNPTPCHLTLVLMRLTW